MLPHSWLWRVTSPVSPPHLTPRPYLSLAQWLWLGDLWCVHVPLVVHPWSSHFDYSRWLVDRRWCLAPSRHCLIHSPMVRYDGEPILGHSPTSPNAGTIPMPWRYSVKESLVKLPVNFFKNRDTPSSVILPLSRYKWIAECYLKYPFEEVSP